MTEDDIKQAVFGAGDGATTTLGMIAMMWFANHKAAIIYAIIGGAIASAIGMGGNEYISDTESSIHRASVMAGATAAGAIIPGIPFVFGNTGLVLPISIALTIILGSLITYIRAKTTGWRLAALEVYGIFLVVTVLTTLAGLLAPN